MTGSSISALIFDLDGTLVDSLPDLAEAMNELMAEFGLPAHEHAAVMAMVGNGAAKLVERAFAAHGVTLAPDELDRRVVRYLDLYEPRSARLTRCYAHVEAVLGELGAHYRLGVCTNKPTAPARQIIADLGLAGHFGAIVGGDSGVPRKPEAGTMLLTAGQLGAAPSDVVMIGDSAADVAAAKAAGMRVIVVRYGYTVVPADQLGADGVVDDFRELPALLDQWRS